MKALTIGDSTADVTIPQTAIEAAYGDFSSFKTKFNTALAGIQGSGWAWLVKDN